MVVSPFFWQHTSELVCRWVSAITQESSKTRNVFQIYLATLPSTTLSHMMMYRNSFHVLYFSPLFPFQLPSIGDSVCGALPPARHQHFHDLLRLRDGRRRHQQVKKREERLLHKKFFSLSGDLRSRRQFARRAEMVSGKFLRPNQITLFVGLQKSFIARVILLQSNYCIRETQLN